MVILLISRMMGRNEIIPITEDAMQWESDYRQKLTSVEEAAGLIKSNDIIFISAGASCPIEVIEAISRRYLELQNVNIASGLLMHPFTYLQAAERGHITHHSGFLGPVERMFMPMGNIEVRPYQFSKIEHLARQRHYNVAIFEVSEPNASGYMSYGPVGTFSNGLISQLVDTIIVQVNKRTPFVNGMQAHIHVSWVDHICEVDRELVQIPDTPLEDEEERIAGFIVERIRDGACIQLGFGKIANAIGYFLDTKKDLGVHSEMLTTSLMRLAQKGVVTCGRKSYLPGTMACSFAIGSRELYEFIHMNPLVTTFPIYQICDPGILGRIEDFVSVNNALCIDLMGQVGSESIGFKMYSGTGGQLDFVRGAWVAPGGQSFIALRSTAQTADGRVSRIRTALPSGTIVTTPRTDVQYVVTEYGLADLTDLSVSRCARALIDIAHPDFRDELARKAHQVGLLN